MNTSSTRLLKTLAGTIEKLQKTVAENSDNADSALIVTRMHREMLSELQSQLNDLEKSHSSMKRTGDDHKREIATIRQKIDAVTASGCCLTSEDLDDTIFMLLTPIKELESQYSIAYGDWKKTNDREETHAKDLLERAQALLMHAKEAVNLEGIVRAAVQNELKQRHREEIAASLLEDGILVWASRTNQFAILMTECLMQIDGHQLTIAPTQLCFDTHSVRSLHQKYRLDHTSIDIEKHEVTIDLRDVEELKSTKRRANIPGTFDEKSPHWEPPKYHQCVNIRTRQGEEYFLADRRNEARDKTWGRLQGAPDGSPSLLCQKLTEIWEKLKRGES
ncbi:uncharacterized protein N0V89_006888 [Didymosphaeria variabile]|uniref:Uncharacterized protein n=1 Tax=Didymosphaeria variabile TaxID=1932322 RepID=A0A9W8XKF0_9PLEO|nr:uncharacterized protein N0V89_006888 [Didymosphaeria variabile]KAJ4351545.1 hypothetical protein N0V89_006888 [Didymosphaeria variabile]